MMTSLQPLCTQEKQHYTFFFFFFWSTSTSHIDDFTEIALRLSCLSRLDFQHDVKKIVFKQSQAPMSASGANTRQTMKKAILSELA